MRRYPERELGRHNQDVEEASWKVSLDGGRLVEDTRRHPLDRSKEGGIGSFLTRGVSI